MIKTQQWLLWIKTGQTTPLMDNFSYFLPLRFSIPPFQIRFLIFGVLNFVWPRGAPFFDIDFFSTNFPWIFCRSFLNVFFTNEISKNLAKIKPIIIFQFPNIQGHCEIVKILLTQPAPPQRRGRGWFVNFSTIPPKQNTNKKQNFEKVWRRSMEKNQGRKCHIWKLTNNEIWSSYIRLQFRHANNQNGSKVSKIARGASGGDLYFILP